MSGFVRRAAAGERFEDIASQTGRSVSEIRHAVLEWAEAEAAEPANTKANRRRQRREARKPRTAATPCPAGEERDRAGTWLRFAGIAVGLLAAAAAAVSYEAQWRLVHRTKHEADISYIQAAIPDLGALVFACFGIALALHGKRAIRARLLNLLCVGISLAMNAFAASPGWRDLAIWVMPSAVYALASDSLIGVIRAYVLARHKQLSQPLADDAVTPLRILGAVVLWVLRLVVAPPSTLKGLHQWVKNLPAAPPMQQPSAPVSELADDARPQAPAITAVPPKAVPLPRREQRAITNGRRPRGGTKQEQFLTLVIARYGPLTDFDIKAVSRAATELAPQAELHPGTARKILRAQVLAAQNGDTP